MRNRTTPLVGRQLYSTTPDEIAADRGGTPFRRRSRQEIATLRRAYTGVQITAQAYNDRVDPDADAAFVRKVWRDHLKTVQGGER